ncbi:MAG: CvpA family protein [Paludibacteraceae bacterium]|nr:CvpA family protein [Paludibacteraceae bacterium]
MNWVDFLILLLVVAGMVRGFSKGVIFELSGLVGLVFAVYISRYHSTPFAEFIHEFFNVGNEYCPALGMVMAFIVSLIVVKGLAMLMVKLIKAVSLGWLNSLLGALISALKYALVISIVMNVLGPINARLNVLDKHHSEDSVLCSPVMSLAPSILPLLNLNELFNLPKNIEDSMNE